jgi:hypothetical protein
MNSERLALTLNPGPGTTALARALRVAFAALSSGISGPELEHRIPATALGRSFDDRCAMATDLAARQHAAPPPDERSDVEDGFDDDLGGFALRAESAQAYNEEAFHYFLDIERKRAQTANRSFLLMLIDVEQRGGMNRPLDEATAGKLFQVMTRCLRETDFIGWYREGRTIGAVLTQHADANGHDSSTAARERVGRAFESELPSEEGRQLQVRIYHVARQVQPLE